MSCMIPARIHEACLKVFDFECLLVEVFNSICHFEDISFKLNLTQLDPSGILTGSCLRRIKALEQSLRLLHQNAEVLSVSIRP